MSDPESLFIALIALEENVKLRANRLANRLRRMFPEIADTVGDPPREPVNESFVIPIGEELVAVVAIPMPIPRETLDYPIGKELMWQGAEAAFARSRAHLLVSSMSSSADPRFARRRAKAVTYVTAALVDEFNALGVMWSQADYVIEPRRFVKEAQAAKPQDVCLDLWTTVHFFKGPNYDTDGKVFARSSGLVAFVGREIECGPSDLQPGELASLVRSLTFHVLDGRAHFQDGDTIGETEAPYARVHFDRSRASSDNKAVFHIELLSQSPG